MTIFRSGLFAVATLLASAAWAQQDTAPAETESAIFAGGCFWCVEEAFDKVPGVVETTSGYAGGTTEDPTYQEVTAGGTGHYEVVQVEYDPAQVTYDQLLDTFWRNIDPFDAAGQFCDKGESYRSAIFVAGDAERQLAESTKEDVSARFDMSVATEVLPEPAFFPAEGYHQDYYELNSVRYNYYKWACGRAQRLEDIWGEPAA